MNAATTPPALKRLDVRRYADGGAVYRYIFGAGIATFEAHVLAGGWRAHVSVERSAHGWASAHSELRERLLAAVREDAERQAKAAA